ncbi:MAG: tRNA (N6-threonylcarbamoyladenosine(37)-N6)-methyltransferase TrmO [Lachnospiraceae bacterium]|nr:tRNA (N6-threonylcarbamoyladenosine(37)-N6)-methyltransferase TrmO [Lachnospiraceae bacterium]
MEAIAHIENDYTEKFGIPRQSGLNEALLSRIVMEPAYRSPEAFRGIEAYSRLWLIWEFSEVPADAPFSPTVRPPRLGGNTRVGVFATRSPFRPNRLGLSCVELVKVDQTAQGPVLIVAGADLMNGTPIYDIKPYLPYADAFPEAKVNEALTRKTLSVVIPDEIKARLPEDKIAPLTGLLALDPRPAYQADPERIYGVRFGAYNVRFRVDGEVLTICGVSPGS